MNKININKVIREIEQRYYDDIWEENGKDLNSNFDFNFALTICIQIIKDNLKEVKQDDILNDLSYYVWEQQSKLNHEVYKGIMKRISKLIRNN
jgi:hypothetical protein